jgi:hypothetical protein
LPLFIGTWLSRPCLLPSAAAVSELNLGERSRLKIKLLAMTVENGCTPAEADNAAQLLLKLADGE